MYTCNFQIVSYLFGASSRIYEICYFRAIGYISMSQCATGPARESRVDPRWPRSGGKILVNQRTYYSQRLLPSDLAPLGAIKRSVTTDGE